MIFFRIQKVLWNLSATLFSSWVLLDMMLWSEFETLDENIGDEYDVIIGKHNNEYIEIIIQYVINLDRLILTIYINWYYHIL